MSTNNPAYTWAHDLNGNFSKEYTQIAKGMKKKKKNLLHISDHQVHANQKNTKISFTLFLNNSFQRGTRQQMLVRIRIMWNSLVLLVEIWLGQPL
jgi:hypothetical protein